MLLLSFPRFRTRSSPIFELVAETVPDAVDAPAHAAVVGFFGLGRDADAGDDGAGGFDFAGAVGGAGEAGAEDCAGFFESAGLGGGGGGGW